jgi:N-methylhydantoinase B
VAGGEPGAVNDTVLEQPGAEPVHVKKHTGLRLEQGSRISFRTAGGGGWGEPGDRPAADVATDVRDGFVTPSVARDVYLVAVGADGVVDQAETGRLRASRR